MNFIHKVLTIERLDNLIRLKATGTPKDLARRLEMSERSIYNIIDTMKEIGAPIKYCIERRSYYYETDVVFEFGFKSLRELRQLRGGKGYFYSFLMSDAK